jgi:hypothetical protein
MMVRNVRRCHECKNYSLKKIRGKVLLKLEGTIQNNMNLGMFVSVWKCIFCGNVQFLAPEDEDGETR